MKKVGIITLCDNDNYGNKLQNYAVIKTFEKIGAKAETIWINSAYKGNKIKQLLRLIKRLYYDYIKKHKRRKYFINFNKKLNIKSMYLFENDMKKLNKKYDIFSVGSDQVWNYTYFNNEKVYFLTDSSKRNISFSASFGTNEVPKKYEKKYQNGLKNFDFISVRENKGKEIVKSLIGKEDVEVLIDPTMMLTDREWSEIARKPKQLKTKKYILNYFLGNLSELRKKEIEKIAKENDCEIINILDENEPLYYSGPSEFLYLEKNAFLICTDSFHSCVFAILFNRPFIIFDREQDGIPSMNSRIETLLSKFQIENRKYNEMNITTDNLNYNYEKAYDILEKERNKTIAFLNKAIEIEKPIY